MLLRRQVLSSLSAAACWPAFCSVSAAEAYPSRPVRLIVPFPPGGVNDTVARPWAEKMRAQFGPIIIDKIYPSAQISEALAYVERGHAKGKVVVAMR